MKNKYTNDLKTSNTRSVDDAFIGLWEKIANIISDIGEKYDEKWQVRNRAINSMLIILLIFRLVSSKNSQGYGTTIDELWDSCHRMNLPLPQKSTIAPSSFCVARKKLDQSAFKDINKEIISTYSQQGHDDSYKWFGHRIFAVDGSKVNLPRSLMSKGYKTPSENAKYPQGLLSCLYQVKSQMPFDFDLVSHSNERFCAKQHLKALKENDVVVYDRGYFSYEMFYRHMESKIHAVFRLKRNSLSLINDFFTGPQTDIVTNIYPSERGRTKLKKDYPKLNIVPLKIRLIKYHIEDETYCLGTTLVDQKRYNKIQDFIDIYHARWGVEELYKVSKRVFNLEDLHAKNVRGVKQEIFAHFALITMSRIFANQADTDLNDFDNSINSTDKPPDTKQLSLNGHSNRIKVNFKNCVYVFTKGLEELILLQSKIKSVVNRAYQFIIGRNQKQRPGRSYPRKSMKPETRWRSSNSKPKQNIQTSPS